MRLRVCLSKVVQSACAAASVLSTVPISSSMHSAKNAVSYILQQVRFSPEKVIVVSLKVIAQEYHPYVFCICD